MSVMRSQAAHVLEMVNGLHSQIGTSAPADQEAQNLREVVALLAESATKLEQATKPSELILQTFAEPITDSELFDRARELALWAQEGAMGIIKSILYMSEIPGVVSDAQAEINKQQYEQHVQIAEQLEDEWTSVVAESRDYTKLKEYITRCATFSEGHIQALHALLDEVYESLNTRRSNRGSPESAKQRSPQKA